MNLKIDSHVHSSLSDGTDSPSELLMKASQAGLDVIGAMDHDTFNHWPAFRQAYAQLAASGEKVPDVILGSEISTSVDGQSIHLLVYLPDPERGNLRTVLRHVKRERLERLKAMFEKIRCDYPLSWRDVEAEMSGLTPGRPHLGDALVRKGYFVTRSEAFDKVLGSNSPYYVSRPVVDSFEVVAAGLADGGVPVIAHPFSTMRGKKRVTVSTLRDLARAGLKGIEVYHREMNQKSRDLALNLATELGLVVSGGSDYHGRGKANQLGENLMPTGSLNAMLAMGSVPLLGNKGLGG